MPVTVQTPDQCSEPAAATSSWTPILDEASARLAEQAIAVVQRDAEQHAMALASGPSLSRGHAGLAVMFAYLSQSTGDSRCEELAVERLESSIAAFAQNPFHPALYSGMTGAGWALAHLSDAEERADDEMFTIVDERIRRLLAAKSPLEEYDLINGLVGIGVYALERLPSRLAASFLARIVEILSDRAVTTADGITWRTPKARWQPWERERPDLLHANLGVAHGVPGIIGLLAHTAIQGVKTDQCCSLVEGAVPWLLEQRLPASAGGRFAYSTGTPEGPTPAPSRLAWCYGDLGIAPVLLAASTATGNDAWRREAIELGLVAAARSLEDSGVQDPGLCHGAAGAGHIFNRLYQATGHPVMLATAQRWFGEALAQWNMRPGIGGFSALALGAGGEAEWVDDAGLLEGAAGVALALQAASTPVEPKWDRMLLCS
jgi:lantibiotic modifying enzyme